MVREPRTHMIPNHLRPDKKAQEFIVKAINFLGFEPFDKPIHRYTWEEFRQISEMYRTAKKEMSLLHRQCKRPGAQTKHLSPVYQTGLRKTRGGKEANGT